MGREKVELRSRNGEVKRGKENWDRKRKNV